MRTRNRIVMSHGKFLEMLWSLYVAYAEDKAEAGSPASDEQDCNNVARELLWCAV
jgi:hypothetical protein